MASDDERAATEKLATVTSQQGVGQLRARAVVHGSDRHIEVAHHEGDVVTFAVNMQGLQVPFTMTCQELANALDAVGIKLPKPDKA